MESDQKSPARFAAVVIEGNALRPLDYSIPDELLATAVVGASVKVSLRGKERMGRITALKNHPSFPKVLPIKEVCHQDLDSNLFALAQWISRYYLCPLGVVLKHMQPKDVREKSAPTLPYIVSLAQTRAVTRKAVADLRGKSQHQAKVLDALLPVQKGMLLSELQQRFSISRSPIDTLVKKGLVQLKRDTIELAEQEYFKTEPKTLSEEQKCAFDKIVASLEKRTFETHLLHGVTGSGKTEVYLQAIAHALEMGKSAILLVPEISLTAQTISRFKSRFDEPVAVLHHRLSAKERYTMWHKIRKGEARIVIGARSAIFSPAPNLGLIVIDEEHERAYKQSESQPCYHARDVAIMRASMCHSVVVLGSATPSLESYANAQSGKYILSELLTRPTTAAMPQVTLVDMKEEKKKSGGYTTFSAPLIEGIQKRFEKGEQTILFLNRRGYHTSLLCSACGHNVTCPHCAVSLTFYQKEKRLACHLCDYKIPPLHTCPTCHSKATFKYKGVGTEQVEKALHAVLPDVRTLRIDGDTTRFKGSHEKLFTAFSTQKADVLIGTQMIAKGLHFPAVTLVAILNLDGSLMIPDFRASESAFQLAVQVAGRAGRGDIPGEVLIQTWMPEHRTLHLAALADVKTFLNEELESRKLFGFPPLCRMIKLTFMGPDEKATQKTALAYASRLAPEIPEAALHPVVASGHAKIKDLYRFQLLIRTRDIYATGSAISSMPPQKLRLHIDVDPLSTFF